MPRKKPWKATGAGACALLLLLGVGRVQSETKLGALLAEQPHPAPPMHDPQKLEGRNQRARALYGLWMARDERDVAAQVVPYLQDEDADIRRSAVRVLGRLESPAGEAPLSQLLTQGGGDQVPEHTLKLALGRIKSRSLKSKAKVEAVTGSMGLSFSEVGRLSQKVKGQREAAGTAGDEAVRETVDVLYHMGKKGEDIQWFASRLSLNPAQKIRLQGASLPLEQEAKLILDHLSHLDVVNGADEELGGRHLLNLGPRATDLILQQLIEIKEHPGNYGQRGYVPIFRAAALTGDPRVAPLLKQFEGNNDPIQHYAMQSRLALQQQSWFPPLP